MNHGKWCFGVFNCAEIRASDWLNILEQVVSIKKFIIIAKFDYHYRTERAIDLGLPFGDYLLH